MAIYIGSGKKRNIRLGATFIKPHISEKFIENALKSSDNYILKDSNGINITAKEEES